MATRRYGPTIVETAADSPDEFAFLANIMANQGDEQPKLAYADWLEEHNDPRGPFLRECVRCTRIPRHQLPKGEEFSPSWLQVVGVWHRQKFRELVADGSISGPEVDQAEAALLVRARPTIYILVEPRADSEFAPGATKFGGLPDLSDGRTWPVRPAYPEGFSTTVFCGQIRLSDLRGTLVSLELPQKGLLSFFFNMCDSSHEAGPLYLQNEEGPFQRTHPPYDPAWDKEGVDMHPLPAGAMRLVEGVDLPIMPELGAVSIEFDNENWEYLRGELREYPEYSVRVPRHQILGYGQVPNGGGPDDRPDIRRFATFSSDHNSPSYWGDSGQPYWYIHQNDLSAGHLERAKVYPG